MRHTLKNQGRIAGARTCRSLDSRVFGTVKAGRGGGVRKQYRLEFQGLGRNAGER
jgi:hypothetical protein